METYTRTCAHFADSWGLLCMMALFFVGVVLFAFRPGAKASAPTTAARIPLKDD